MAGRIPDETLQTIRERVSLVEVVSRYVSLKKTGRNHLGLCPFHNEKTPSFTVNDERGLFHCFGCGAGGTVFTFLMRVERIEFTDAVAQLAVRAGVELPQAEPSGAAAARDRLYALNAQAARFFRDCLHGSGGAAARRYLSGRGVAAEIVDRYGVGLAPASGGALTGWMRQQRLATDAAVQLGLLGRRDDGGLYDRFRGRVMFPIRDRRERIIAFGGRTLGDDQPKYLNSPESPLFRKGEGLYGLAEAREAIRSAGRVVLVEGYLDALLLVQEGVPYTVAVLGTALTAAQLRLLRPFGGDELEVLFLFDGDEAGRKAAARAFAVCAEADVWGKAAFLPEGFDPDSYVRAHGGAATRQVLDAAVPLLDVYLDRSAPAGAALPQRVRAGEEVARVLAGIRSEVRFDALAQRAAARLGLSDEVFRRTRVATAAPTRVAAVATTTVNWPAAEVLLVETMAADRQVAEWVAQRGALALFADRELAAAGQCLIEAWMAGQAASAALDRIAEPLASRLTAAVLRAGAVAEADPQRVAEDCTARIEARAQQSHRRAVAATLRRAEARGDAAEERSTLADLNALHRRAQAKEVRGD